MSGPGVDTYTTAVSLPGMVDGNVEALEALRADIDHSEPGWMGWQRKIPATLPDEVPS